MQRKGLQDQHFHSRSWRYDCADTGISSLQAPVGQMSCWVSAATSLHRSDSSWSYMLLITDKKLDSVIYWPVLLAFRLKHTLFSSARNGCLIGRWNSSPGVKQLWLSSLYWYVFCLHIVNPANGEVAENSARVSHDFLPLDINMEEETHEQEAGHVHRQEEAELVHRQQVSWTSSIFRHPPLIEIIIEAGFHMSGFNRKNDHRETEGIWHRRGLTHCMLIIVSDYDPNYNMNATRRYSEGFLSFRWMCGKSMTLMLSLEEINPLNQVNHTPQCFYSPQHCHEYSNITCMSKQSDNRSRYLGLLSVNSHKTHN